MTPNQISACEKLEKLLSKGKGIDIPWNKKQDLATNPSRVEWIKKNFDVKNSKHPDRATILNLIDQILES